MKLDQSIRDLWQNYKGNILLLAAITFIIIALPNKNLLTILLAVLAPVFTHKLLTQTPQVLSWAKTALVISAWTAGFYLAATWLGLLGVLGVVLFVAIIIIFRLWKARKLLLYTFKWGADYLETGRLKRFRGFARKYK